MKHLLHLLILPLLLSPCYINAQWTWEDISPQYDQERPFHLGCHAPNDSTLWAVPFWLDFTTNPKFAVTSNSGDSWTVGTPDIEDPELMPAIVYALNADTAWIATQHTTNGDYGTLHVTYDRGDTWSLVDIPYNGIEVPYAIHFYNALEGIVIAQDFFTSTEQVHIYRTADGGTTWTDVSPSLQTGEVMWVYNGESVMERIGDKLFIGTGRGRVLRSVDRGNSWDVTDVGLGNLRGMHSVAFEDENTGIILSSYDLDSLNNATRNGITLAAKTTDGGDTWTPIPIPPTAEHIEYVPNSGGVYVAGQGYTGWPQYYISYDGGQQWKEKGSPGMINIVYTDQDVGYATTFGIDNGIVRYTGPTLEYDDAPLPPSDWLGQGTGTLPYGNFVGNYVNEIAIIDEQNVWAISAPSRNNGGQSPYSLKTNDGGLSWEANPIPLVLNYSGLDIHAFNAQNALASLNNGQGGRLIMKTEDGGSNWAIHHTSDASGGYIHFFNDQEGLIINNGAIEVTQDGGESWEAPASLPEIAAGDISDLVFAGIHRDESKGNHFWYVSSINQKIFRTTDRGQSWESFPTPASFNSLAMKDSLNGLAVEIGVYNTSLYVDSTTIYRTQDGGENWEILSALSDSFTIRQIEYITGSQGSYVGSSAYNSSTSYSNDNGQSWTFIDENFFSGVVRFHNTQTGWAAKVWGNEGYEPVIYKWNGAPFPELIVNTQEQTTPKIFVKTYPNPCADYLNIAVPTIWPGEVRQLQLLDAGGRVVQNIRTYPAERQWQLDMRDLPAGSYFLQLRTGTGQQLYPVLKQ